MEGTPFGRYSERPYPGNTAEQQIIAHVTAPPPQPSLRRRGIRPGFDAVIAKGMAKSVDERYQTAGELSLAAEVISTPFRVPPPPSEVQE